MIKKMIKIIWYVYKKDKVKIVLHNGVIVKNKLNIKSIIYIKYIKIIKEYI